MKRIFVLLLISLLTSISLSAQSSAPYWLVGRWKSDSDIYVFNDTTMKVFKDGKLVNEGTFVIDDSRSGCVNTTMEVRFKNGDEEYFIIFDNKSLAIEGGDFLERIVDPRYEWLYGKWESPGTPKDDPYYSCVIITPFYTQTYNAVADEGETFEQMPKKPFKMSPSVTSIEGTYIIDFSNRALYWLYDFDIKMYLKKVD